tara:strand:- start:118 stop:378 length:261 start_codon:yes stop_codon:yes gene_type:complete
LLEHPETVDLGEHDINQHKGWALALERCETLWAGLSDDRVVTTKPNHLRQLCSEVTVVLDNQDSVGHLNQIVAQRLQERNALLDGI